MAGTRLEAYATLTLRSVGRCSESPAGDSANQRPPRDGECSIGFQPVSDREGRFDVKICAQNEARSPWPHTGWKPMLH